MLCDQNVNSFDYRPDYWFVGDLLLGFAVVGSVVMLGYIVGSLKILGADAADTLGKTAFFAFSPALLFVVLADSDIGDLFSVLLPVSIFAAMSAFFLYLTLSWLLRIQDFGRSIIGGLAASYVNSTNLGLPLAAYILGDTALVAPVLLFQLVVFSPLALVTLELLDGLRVSFTQVCAGFFRNPLILASGMGVLIAFLEASIPMVIRQPLELLGQAAVPTLLFCLGLSLSVNALWERREYRLEVISAVTIKVILMPLAAFIFGKFFFSLEPQALFAVVVLGALPTAQNVFNYSQRYSVATLLARDSVALSTLLSVPILLLVTFFLGSA